MAEKFKIPVIERSVTIEIIGLIAILILLYLTINQYYPSTIETVNYYTEKKIDDLNERYPLFKDTITKYSKKYYLIGKTIKFLNKNNPFDESRKYTYLDYYELEEAYSELEDEFKLINFNKSKEYNETAGNIVVLNYHGTVGYNADEYSIPAEIFKEHMFALKKSGYKTVGINELYEFLRGEKKLPKKSFVITFDDGLKDTYYNVDPILKILDYKAIMFVITGQSLEKDSKYYLNRKELWRMEDSGRWEIQSHSHLGHGKVKTNKEGDTGPFLSNKIWLDNENRLETDDEYKNRILKDMITSKEVLEKEFNKPVIGFALPFGDFGQRESNYHKASETIVDITDDLFNLVFYQFKPAINKDFRANYNNKKETYYLVMRIPADSIKSSKNLLEEINAAQSLELPYSENFDNKKRWISLWGSANINNNSIIINNDKLENRGALTYLDGSYIWNDYSYSLVIKENNAKRNILLVRFQDSENYVGCKYDKNSISIINVRKKIRTIERIEFYKNIINKTEISNKDLELKVTVKEKTVSCYFKNKELLKSQVSNIPSNGGVGIRIEELNNTNPSIITDIRINNFWDKDEK